MIVFTYYMHGRQQGEQALAPLPLENKKTLYSHVEAGAFFFA